MSSVPEVLALMDVSGWPESDGCACVPGDCYDDPEWPLPEHPRVCSVCVALGPDDPCPKEDDRG